MATVSLGIGTQLAVRRELEHLFGTAEFPGGQASPFTKAATWKLQTYPYTAIQMPDGARSLLVLVTVNGRCMAALVSRGMVVTRAHLPTVPQSLFKGSVFDGFLDKSGGSLLFTVTDCLAFKGHHDRRLSFCQRMAGCSFLLNAIEPGQAGTEGTLQLQDSSRTQPCNVPASGTWMLVPDLVGFAAARVQPDAYVVCLDDVHGMLLKT